jgi:C4-dicarboxylate-specific signal transduction histidine kinase
MQALLARLLTNCSREVLATFYNLRIYYKLVVAFACVIAVIFATSAIVYERLTVIEAAKNTRVHTLKVLQTLQQALDALVDQETGLRGYLLTGDEKFLQPYHVGAANFNVVIQRAKDLTKDNLAQQSRLDELSELARKWHSTVAEREITLMATPATREEARALETSGAGKNQMDLIRAKVDEIKSAESDLLAKRDVAQTQAFATAYTITILGGIMSLLVAALMGVLLMRSIAIPLGRITGALTAITSGDTNVEVPEVNRGDEIGVLAKTTQIFKDTMIERQNVQAEMARIGRLTTMGELAASIAHEINQPLAAIRTNADVGLRWLTRAEPNLEEVKEVMSSIALDAERAGKTIENVRRLTKKSEVKFEYFDINTVIEEVLALTRSELKQHNIAPCTELLPGDLMVYGDRLQLQQVLLNLVMNGIEAMSEDTDSHNVLTISSERIEPNRMVIAVKDTGAGIDPDDADRIFESFFTTKRHGMGMGLSICKSIIEAHGECLWTSPNTPHGTIFQFTLAISPGEQRQSSAL